MAQEPLFPIPPSPSPHPTSVGSGRFPFPSTMMLSILLRSEMPNIGDRRGLILIDYHVRRRITAVHILHNCEKRVAGERIPPSPLAKI